MQLTHEDPRQVLLSDIDLKLSRVEFSSLPIVLLCGGKVKIKNHPDDPDPAIASLRHFISRTQTSFEIFRPEEITSWQSDGIFKNLMSFEEDLANICSLVVIILESAGSLTELGAFSQLNDLSKKIIAIRSSKFKDDPSFINLGILRYISEDDIANVKSYPWDLDNPTLISQEIVNDVISDIEDTLSQLPKTQTLKLSNNSHIIVLICEFIKFFTALKEHEIHEYLTSMNVVISKDELKRKLFLLAEFRLIKKEIYSDATFYLRGNEEYHKLRITLKGGSYPDVLRIKMDCLEFYNSNEKKHRNRIRAIAQHEAGSKI
jgi:hypothetical protein